jgi:hypothetical protein
MITYPLVIPGPPATPGPNKVNPKMFDAVGEFVSPFVGSSQQQQNQDQHWELDLDWPEMTWTQFAPLAAFAGALHGKWGSFLWGPPLGSAPQGSALGMPVTAGTDLSGSNLLTTQAWLPNESGVLLPGDYLQIGQVPSTVPVGAVEVDDNALFIFVNCSYATALANFPPGATLSFSEVEFATWLNGSTLVIEAIGNTSPLVQLTMATTPPGMPLNLSYEVDSGNATTRLPRLYQYVNPNPLVTDGGGNAELDIFPALHEAPYAGMPLILSNPQGTFRLAENRRETPTSKTKTFTFQMKCREAI